MTKSLRPPPADPDLELVSEVRADLRRLKWFLWHGNVFRALTTIEGITIDLETLYPGEEPTKLGKAVREFDSYLRANAERIPNYGERRRASEAISTAFVESAVNQVISKRMVKKQQMRWSPRGAHLLLQVRTRILNDTLTNDYRRWYPSFTHTPQAVALDDQLRRHSSHGMFRSPAQPRRARFLFSTLPVEQLASATIASTRSPLPCTTHRPPLNT